MVTSLTPRNAVYSLFGILFGMNTHAVLSVTSPDMHACTLSRMHACMHAQESCTLHVQCTGHAYK